MEFDNNKIVSSKIKDFLDFTEDSKRDHEYYNELLVQHDKETQDILHILELNQKGYSDLAKLASKLKAVRQERRRAKVIKQNLQPLITFLETDQAAKFIYKLQAVLGEVRKVEKYTSTQITYHVKTDILTRGEANEESDLEFVQLLIDWAGA
ncbi:MAG: hypothetical protein LBR56_02870 [Sporomusaceae bacterium]|jgi:hypothetical protein|nr:hypothetical protein [Sporomusaceae bacterium]